MIVIDSQMFDNSVVFVTAYNELNNKNAKAMCNHFMKEISGDRWPTIHHAPTPLP